MKKSSVILFITLVAFFSMACDSTSGGEEKGQIEEGAVKKGVPPEVKKTDAPVKTAAEILVGGSWNNPAAIRSEDVIFNANGTMFWRSGSDEGEGKWEVKGTDILFFYGKDYKIEELTETKLVVSEGGEKTTYERNSVETSDQSPCKPQFKVEGINVAKGLYTKGDESWTIHFADNGFIAFYTKDSKQDGAIAVEKIVKISDCEYSIMMEGIQGEKVPTWTLKYNEAQKYYDLHTHSYNAGTDTWSDNVYEGSSDNG